MSESSFDSFQASIGERIRAIRVSKKYSLRQLALLAEIEHHQLINIEKGRLDIRLSTLHKIAVALDVDIKELL